MQRLRFYDLRLSRLPRVLGLCLADIPDLANYINAAQERLLTAKEIGDEGWWGTWAEVAFNVSRTTPVIVLPREIARLEMMDICNKPVTIHNQFYEYLEFGAGRRPNLWRAGSCCGFWGNGLSVYSRDNGVTFSQLNPTTPQIIRMYCTNPNDAVGRRRVLLQGKDINGQVIYSQDGQNRVTGEFVPINAPFSDSTFIYSSLSGIQKDVTQGQVQFFQVDPTTGAEVPLHTMDPSEMTALYRRYYLHHLPQNCCSPDNPTTNTTVQVTALAKLDLIPVAVDTDYCLIQSPEAIINECEAIRYEKMDSKDAHEMADRKHSRAIRLLIGQMTHYLGKNVPEVNFKPFGSASLERLNIGMI